MSSDHLEEQVQNVQSLLPFTDSGLIRTTLIKFDFDLDRSIDYLLNSTDTSSDEAMARQLHQQETMTNATTTLGYQPYRPRNKSNSTQSSQSAPSDQLQSRNEAKDELDQLSEHFERLAASGSVYAKQGASTLKTNFMKGFEFLKEEINQLDQPTTAAPSQQQQEQSQSPYQQPQQPQPRFPAPSPLPPVLSRSLPTNQAANFPLPPSPDDSHPSVVLSTTEPSSSLTDAPPSVNAAGNTDFSTIGLLPRQSVLLKKSNRRIEIDDDEDEEFVRSPFEDQDDK